MTNRNKINIPTNINDDDDDFSLPKLDPVFRRRMQEYYQNTSVESPPELRQELLELVRTHKRTLEKENKLNNSDWLKVTQPTIIPTKDLGKLFRLDGFAISNLRVAGALLVITIIAGGVSYVVYQYESNESQNTVLNNQPTPIIKAFPISTATPEVNLTPTPFIAENSKNDSNPNVSIPNEQNPIIAKEKTPNPNKLYTKSPKNLANDQIAYNSNNKPTPNIAEVSKDVLRGIVVDISLLETKQFYVTNFGDSESDKLLRQALIERLQNTDFDVLTASQALSTDSYGKIIKKGDEIKIVNSSTDTTLWYKSTKLITGSPKEVADILVNSLLEDIKNQEKK